MFTPLTWLNVSFSNSMAADVNAGMNPFPVTQFLAADTLALIQNARMNGIKRYRTTLS
jgi:hypothetical protein